MSDVMTEGGGGGRDVCVCGEVVVRIWLLFGS